MANKRLRSMDDDDRISELPDDIFHKILSYLPSKDAARTSILCKFCFQAWQSYPVLDFDQSYFGKELPRVPFRSCKTTVTGNPEAEKSLEKFIEFVDQSIETFSHKKLQLKRFKIFISLIDSESRRLMDKWIGLALKNLVEELDLSFGYKDTYKLTLPQSVYGAVSLKALSLRNCEVSIRSSTSINFSSLKKLHLKNVKFDKKTMHRLIASCPHTEHLLLEFINGREIVDLSGLKHLRSVDVISFKKSGKLLFEAYNLEKLYCENITSLEFRNEFFLRLRDLHLFSLDITDQCLHNLVASSAHIESLKITCCRNLEKLKMSSDSLLKFEICDCNKLAIDIHALNLRHFSYGGEGLLPSFRLTSPLCFALLDIYSNYKVAGWIRFLSNPVQLMHLRLNLRWPPMVSVLKRLEETSPLPTIWKVEHLEFLAITGPSIYDRLMKLLVRSCRPKTVSIRKHGDGGQVKYIPSTSFLEPGDV